MLEIVKIPLKKITPYEGNAKLHNKKQVEHIVNSIKEFGFVNPIAVWGEDNVIVAGHGRYLALKKLKYKEAECVRVDHLSDEQRRALTIADNHINSETGYDLDIFDRELERISNIDMSELGFEIETREVSEEIEYIDEEPADCDPDECIVKAGDEWRLGKHKLFCIDGCDTEMVCEKLGRKTADLIIATSIANGAERNYRGFLMRAYETIRETLKSGKNAYIFHSSDVVDDVVGACRESGLIYEQNLVWAKPSFSADGSLYHRRYELCLLARNGGTRSDRTWNGSSQVNDVLETQNIDEMTEDEVRETLRNIYARRGDVLVRDGAGFGEKPVALIRELMLNSSCIGELVVDLFAYTGTVLVTAEQCARKCYAFEVDPVFCTKIIRRWERLTGERGVRVSTDATW